MADIVPPRGFIALLKAFEVAEVAMTNLHSAQHFVPMDFLIDSHDLLCDLIDERGIHPGFKEILEGVAELWCQSNEGEAATEGVVYNSERPVGRVHTANYIDILRDKEGLIRRVGIS